VTDAGRGENPTALIYECYLDSAEVLVWPSSRLVEVFQLEKNSSSFFIFIRYYQHAVDTHAHFKQSVCGLLMNYCRELLMKNLSLSLSHFPGVIPDALRGDQENDFRGGRGSAN